MRRPGPGIAHADARMAVRRARRAGAGHHGRGGRAHGRGLSRRSHRHRGRQPGGRGAGGRSAARVRPADGRQGHRRSAATRPRNGAQHGALQRGVQRRFQPAHLVARGVGEVPVARQGDALRRSRLARRNWQAGFRHAARSGPIRGSRQRSGAGVGTQLNIGASTFRVSRDAHQPARPGSHVPGTCTQPHHERRGPGDNAAHPAG